MKRYHHLIILLFLLIISITATSQEIERPVGKFFHAVNAIPGRYIVVLDEKAFPDSNFANRVESASYELAGEFGANVDRIYETAIRGFSAEMSEKQAIELSKDPRVLYVEEDAVAYATATQSNPTWGLDRIDQREYPLDGTYQYTSTGAGVNAYIVDSGIRISHQDFGGRAYNAIDFVPDGRNGADCFGHGTHIAGTVGSTTYGVAKGVNLHNVRVLGCDGQGTLSNIIAAVNWVTANRVLPAVANISITISGVSLTLDTAISNSIASGVTYSIAAGNFGMDACSFSPGRNPNAITVGSAVNVGSNDWRMSYSNYGPCVDVFAPGNGIISLSNGDDVSARVMNGTSMAAPHAAGVAALYLQDNPTASPASILQLVKNSATTGTVTNIDGTSPNKMLYSWINGAAPPVSPARVTIVKEIINAQGGTASSTVFGYSATNLGTAGFALVDNDAPPADRYENPNVLMFESLNDINVTESTMSGWVLESIQCVEVAGAGLPNVQNTTVDVANRKATIKVEAGEQVTCTFRSRELAPSSSPASLTGRVLDSRGKAIKNVSVSIRNGLSGASVAMSTNSFGYFSFGGLRSGDLYTVTAHAKRQTFSPSSQTIILDGDLAGVNFMAQ